LWSREFDEPLDSFGMSPPGTHRTCQACTIMSVQRDRPKSFERSDHSLMSQQA
jgi:hypothetical protein